MDRSPAKSKRDAGQEPRAQNGAASREAGNGRRPDRVIRHPAWITGEHLFRQGRYDRARRVWEQLLAKGRILKPEQRDTLRERLAETYFRQAMSLKPLEGARRASEQALQLLERAMQANSADVRYPYWCGVICRRLGQPRKALAHLRRAVHLDGSSGWSVLQLGWAYLAAGETASLDKLLANFPEATGRQVPDWQWKRLRAAASLRAGRALDALEVYPRSRPAEMAWSQWWEEFTTLVAAAAGAIGANRVLERLEEWGFGAAAGERWEQSRAGDRLEAGEVCSLLGKLAADAGNVEKARHYWDRVPTKGPSRRAVQAFSLSLLDRRARAALREGRVAEAVAAWQEALAENPDNAALKTQLAQALVLAGCEAWRAEATARAMDLWRQAKTHDPGLAAAWHNLGMALERVGRWADANQAWMQFLHVTRKPPSDGLLAGMASNAVRAGREEEAVKHLDRLGDGGADRARHLTLAALLHLRLKRGSKSLELLERALQLQPAFEPAIKALALTCRAKGVDARRALKLWQDTVFRLLPGSTVPGYWRSQLLRLGIAAWQAGDADRAMESFASLLLADPGDVEAWLWSGTVHLKKGNRKGCAACFEKAVRLQPERAQTHVHIGAHLMAVGEKDRAVEAFNRALEIGPESAQWLMIGEACAEIGLPELAEEHFEAAMRHASPGTVVRIVRSLIRSGHEDRITRFLEAAYEVRPPIPYVRLLLAAHHLRRCEWRQAEEKLAEAGSWTAENKSPTVAEHVTFLQRCMILLETVGVVDERAFEARLQVILDEWISAEGMAVPDKEPGVDELSASLLGTLLSPASAADCMVPDVDLSESPEAAEPVVTKSPDLDVFLRVLPGS